MPSSIACSMHAMVCNCPVVVRSAHAVQLQDNYMQQLYLLLHTTPKMTVEDC